MIESRLDPLTDGAGGGYGNYPGLTVAEIAERFRLLAEEGHIRSVRAILRIVHEQISARGTLSVGRIMASLGVLTIAILAIVRTMAAPDQKAHLTLYLGATVATTLLFAVGAATMERTVRRHTAQIREIRRLALLALERVVDAPEFRMKTLEREHRRSLAEMRKVDPERWAKITAALAEPN